MFSRHRPPIPQQPMVSGGLRGQFMWVAAVLLVLACITLGWFFVRQQIRTVTDGLYRTGVLLAENLAANSRYGLISRDKLELARLAHGILAVNDVAYVSIFTATGHPLIAIGKDRWEELLTKPDAVISPINPALPSHSLSGPAVGTVTFLNGGATFSSDIDFTTTSIVAVLSGRHVDHFYNISVPILPSRSTNLQDSNLRLLFDQQDSIFPPDDASKLPLGIVEVGISSLSAQEQLRKLMWQAFGITGLILLMSLLLLGFFSHHITTPLRRLTYAANRVAEGEKQIVLPPTAAGEIGNLTQVFSHMLHSIQERETALQDLNHTLEDRITARTDELRLANHKLQELNHRKSLFVSTASHEIKTPLTSITCHLDNLLMGVAGPLLQEQTKVLGRIQVNIGRLQRLLVDLLDLCKIELGEAEVDLQPVNAHTVVTQAVENLQSFASGRGVFIDIDIPPMLPMVIADAEKLHQIVTNLLHNALKFSPDYGTVRITGQASPDGFVRIAVQDSGCGIARGEAEKIFEPFYRSKKAPTQTRGTGLGLSIAKQLIALHHGRLWVDSEIVHGACFFFTLPILAHTYTHSTHQEENALTSKQSSSIGSSGSSGPPM